MSLLLGYSNSNGGGGSSSGGGGSNGSSSGAAGSVGQVTGHPGDLLYQDVVRALSPGNTGQGQAMVTTDTCHGIDWHGPHHHHHTQDPRHLQDLHSPYSLESDSAIGLSPSPDLSLSGLSSCSNNCMSISSSCGSSSSSSTRHDDSEAAAAAASHASAAAAIAPPPAKKSRRRGGRGTPRTPPRQSIDVNDNSLYAVYELFKSFLSASTASTVAIDNKIEQAMDLVKSHLMFAVREEVEVLKEKITELMERINQLEYENTVLKQYATNEALQQIQQHHNSNT